MRRRQINNGKKIIEAADKGIAFVGGLSMKTKILIADDDPAIRDVFKMIFDRPGYEIEIKEDGKDILKNNYDLPHVFLIDKQLSGMDGLQICRHLKDNDATKDIPVIMVSASPDIGMLAQQVGADDYIEKPFDLKRLLKMVEKYARPTKKSASQRFDKF